MLTKPELNFVETNFAICQKANNCCFTSCNLQEFQKESEFFPLREKQIAAKLTFSSRIIQRTSNKTKGNNSKRNAERMVWRGKTLSLASAEFTGTKNLRTCKSRKQQSPKTKQLRRKVVRKNIFRLQIAKYDFIRDKLIVEEKYLRFDSRNVNTKSNFEEINNNYVNLPGIKYKTKRLKIEALLVKKRITWAWIIFHISNLGIGTAEEREFSNRSFAG